MVRRLCVRTFRGHRSQMVRAFDCAAKTLWVRSQLRASTEKTVWSSSSEWVHSGKGQNQRNGRIGPFFICCRALSLPAHVAARLLNTFTLNPHFYWHFVIFWSNMIISVNGTVLVGNVKKTVKCPYIRYLRNPIYTLNIRTPQLFHTHPTNWTNSF